MEFLKDGKLMSAFLIDYENINGVSILPVLDLLSPQDKLILFYSKACSSLRKEYWDIEKLLLVLHIRLWLTIYVSLYQIGKRLINVRYILRP